MTGGWAGSGRTNTSTSTWRRLRQHILTRDHGICHLCRQPGADTVDHITPIAEGGTDNPANLAAVHDRNPPHCHRMKSSAEGGRGKARKRRRPADCHPGLL